MKRIIIILLFLCFAVGGNSAGAANGTIGQTAGTIFQEKTGKDTINTCLQHDFKSKNYGNATSWTIWYAPSVATINKNTIRVQLAGGPEYLSYVNIELYANATKSAKDFAKVFPYVQKIYNTMFPKWADDDFLRKNFAALTKDSSQTVVRDNIVFQFCFYDKANMKQVIISPKQ